MNTQLDFFTANPVISKPRCSDITGLTYVPNYIDAEYEEKLIKIIDEQIWLSDLKRRVQHYGYKYEYKTRRINLSMKVGKLPEWLNSIAQRLYAEGYFKEQPDQVIINEYEPGQGIAAHIDCEPCFEDTIVSLSLLSATTMNFFKENHSIPLVLEARSVVILQGESRYEWKHSIATRQSDKIDNQIIKRKRRVSLTFRKVIYA